MKTRILSLLLALCLIAGILPFAALAEDAAPYIGVQIENGGTYFWNEENEKQMTAGAATRYATTTAEGVVAAATESDNWNIKLEYPADGKPTLTLKGATIKAGTNRFPLTINGTVDLTVVIESDSTISSDNRPAVQIFNFGVTTLTGAGKLTVATESGVGMYIGHATSVDAGETIFKDAKIDINYAGDASTRMAISFFGKDLTIDNSVVNFTGTGRVYGIWGYGEIKRDADGKVTSAAGKAKLTEGDVERDLIIKNGSVVTGVATIGYGLGASGNVYIKDSTVEVTVGGNGGTFPVFPKKPVFEGEYTAVGGQTNENPVEFVASKFSGYKYFKIVPGKANVSGGTTGGTTGGTSGGTTGGTTTTNPSTGDTFNVVLVSGLALASLASLAAVTVIGKKKVI